MANIIKRGIGVWDLHHPLHNKVLLKSIFKLTKDLRPDIFVLGGDNMNMSSIDHWLHEDNRERQLEGKRILNDYNDFNKEILFPLDRILKRSCRKIWHNGNHENWVELAIDQNKQGEGYWEIENNLHLKERDWEFYKYGEYAKIGKIYTIHGQYTNQYHSKKTVDIFERNVLYGHSHTLQAYTKITPVENEPHTAICVPCACDVNPDYMRNRPNAWVKGLVVFYIAPSGYFNIYPIISIDGHFVFNGKYY